MRMSRLLNRPLRGATRIDAPLSAGSLRSAVRLPDAHRHALRAPRGPRHRRPHRQRQHFRRETNGFSSIDVMPISGWCATRNLHYRAVGQPKLSADLVRIAELARARQDVAAVIIAGGSDTGPRYRNRRASSRRRAAVSPWAPALCHHRRHCCSPSTPGKGRGWSR